MVGTSLVRTCLAVGTCCFFVFNGDLPHGGNLLSCTIADALQDFAQGGMVRHLGPNARKLVWLPPSLPKIS